MSVNKNLSARRKEKDIFKLRSADYKVEQSNESESTYSVEFIGPPNTPYARGKWQINLYLPEDYPYKSPSVGFGNKIYHPNIDFDSGSVCLDVINQTWTPMYELVNVFQIFLPQLLTYPNPASPLNHEAAELYERNPKEYNRKVNDLIDKHAFTQQEAPIQIEIPHILPDPPQTLEAEQAEMIDQTCSLSDHDSLQGNDELGMY